MIDVAELTKKFGDKVAVDSLSFSVHSGMVTGFLGPNGAGKTTTMRLILGLAHPTHGRTRVNGRAYTSAKAPITEVGAVLEAKSVHPGRTAQSHLRALAATHGISRKRVDEMIDMVGLGAVAKKRSGTYSLGMSQRLGLAAALLGDPQTLILDEPINGLDPEGVTWVRNLVNHQASQGKTVFLSSHLMSEMALVANHIIIIGMGRLIVDSPMSDLVERSSGVVTRVRSPQLAEIAEAVVRSGRGVKDGGDGSILVMGLTPSQIGDEATRCKWTLHELTPIQRSLEDIYMELTNSAQEFHAVPQSVPNLPKPAPIRLPQPKPVEPPPMDDEDEFPAVTTSGTHRITDIFRDDPVDAPVPPQARARIPDPVRIPPPPELDLGPQAGPISAMRSRPRIDPVVRPGLGPPVETSSQPMGTPVEPRYTPRTRPVPEPIRGPQGTPVEPEAWQRPVSGESPTGPDGEAVPPQVYRRPPRRAWEA